MPNGTPTLSTSVNVWSSQDPTSVVAAIKALNLPHVRVEGHVTQPMKFANFIAMPFELTLSLFVSAGLVFVVFKRLCKRMEIEPTV